MSTGAVVFSVLVLAVVVGLFLLGRLGGRHQVADWGNPLLNRLDGLNRLFCARFHRMQSDPIDLPETGGAIVASNHISGLDPMAIIAASPRPLRFLIADNEYDRWWLKWLFKSIGCIPVDRTGRPDRAMRRAREALEAGEIVAIFPQGGLSDPDKPPVRPKRGAIFLADLAKVPIVPLHVSGVGAPGKIVGAVFVRSHLRIKSGPWLLADLETRQRTAELADFIVPELSSDQESGETATG